eukprot:824544-Pyramimonas_sp.AAC.2
MTNGLFATSLPPCLSCRSSPPMSVSSSPQAEKPCAVVVCFGADTNTTVGAGGADLGGVGVRGVAGGVAAGGVAAGAPHLRPEHDRREVRAPPVTLPPVQPTSHSS